MFRHPQRHHIVGGRPHELAHAVHLDGGALVALVFDELAVVAVHIDAVVAQPREESVVVRPFEDRPLELLFWLRALERAQLLPSRRLPHDERLRLVGLRGPGDDELLARREVDQLDAAVVQLEQLLPRGSPPQHNAESVERRQVLAVRRPRDIRIAPVGLRVARRVVWLGRVVPPDLSLVVVAYHELIPRPLVHQPAAKVLARHILRRDELGLLVRHRGVLVVVLQGVDDERVRLVQLVSVCLLCGGECLRLALKLDECVAERVLIILVHGHF
mmetsp:Transcript_29945/g.62833  ORF Transcript_29945/g.62833 Transcript_29945/m.62833 type:complete len:273 (+) Transcript_29945:1207-2025(+)